MMYNTVLNIEIKKLSENAIIPMQGTIYAAGYDLYSIDEPTMLQHGERKLFKTGIHIQKIGRAHV